ncbi:MAG: hypothetical protein ACHQNT_02795 [Bacteroidia bacterium]
MKRTTKYAFLSSIFFFLSVNFSFAQEELIKKDLFSIPVKQIFGEGAFTFKLAVDGNENIAINSCNKPLVYFINVAGIITDSVKVPFESCVRNMEFDEYDNLLIMDNEEKNIYKYDSKTKKAEIFPYTKPEDWYTLQNHYYKYFEISSIPTFYINKDYLQDAYYTRFYYMYNLWLNYSNGFIYQSAYNFIRKVGNHRSYIALKKSDLWFSERLSNKCKLLLIDLDKEVAVYYNRALVLIYEDFKNNFVREYYCPTHFGDAVQFDFASNVHQKKIWGVSDYNRDKFTVSVWMVNK